MRIKRGRPAHTRFQPPTHSTQHEVRTRKRALQHDQHATQLNGDELEHGFGCVCGEPTSPSSPPPSSPPVSSPSSLPSAPVVLIVRWGPGVVRGVPGVVRRVPGVTRSTATWPTEVVRGEVPGVCDLCHLLSACVWPSLPYAGRRYTYTVCTY